MRDNFTLDIVSVLDAVTELGFVDFRSKLVILPKYSVLSDSRWNFFAQFLQDYKSLHEAFSLSAYFTIYDGWREHAEPSDFPLYTKFSVDQLKFHGFIGFGTIFLK